MVEAAARSDGTGKTGSVADVRNIRKSSLPYIILWIIYYAWVVSFSTWWTASPTSAFVFDAPTRSLMHTVNLLSSAVFVFIIRRHWFAVTARASAALLALGMPAFLLAGHELSAIILAGIISVFIGMLNISGLMPFVFVLNNTEKMYSVVGANVLVCLFGLFAELYPDSLPDAPSKLTATYVFLLAGLSCVVFFRQSDLPKSGSVPKYAPERMDGRIVLTLLFSCLFTVLSKGAGKGLLNTAADSSPLPVVLFYFLGGLAGCILCFLVFAFVEKGVHIIWNIAFASIAMGLLCNALSADNPGLLIAFSVLLGISGTAGMINMYYILGVIGKQYTGMRYVRLSILLIGICGGLAGVAAGNFVDAVTSFEVSVATSLISAGIMLLLLIISPAVTHSYYGAVRGGNPEGQDIPAREGSHFDGYSLTKRELEVCGLLLEGHTMRQISAMLSLAYPTVNTYCTCAYRKLGINSRTELLLRFGNK